MFGVKEMNKKEDNGIPALYENVTDNIRFNKISNYSSNSGNSYCDANNSQMLTKFLNNERYGEQQNDYNRNSDDDDYGNLRHYNNSKKEVIQLNSSCKLSISDDRKSSNAITTTTTTTTTTNNSYHSHHEYSKSERSTSNSPVQFSVMVQQQQYQKKHQNQNSDSNRHQTVDEVNGNFVSDDDDDEGDGDDDSTDSEFSDLSGLSDISGQDWKPMTKPINWVQKQIHLGADPREILSQILSNGTTIAPNLNDMTLWRILANILSEPPRRPKLKNINTINDVVRLLKTSKNIIVLTGAGVSVSCGIPDFRSNNGIYNRLAKDFPDLPDPQAMFDINYFSKDPRPFYKFAREIYPGQFIPSPCHRFIKLLEKKQKLLRNYTQNIDTLEQVAGIKNVIECHGSFATASCTKCKYKTTADEIRDDIFAQRIPICPKCQSINELQAGTEIVTDDNNDEFDQINKISSFSEIVQNGIMKPDIVFFGEGLPDAFHTAMASDKDKCDLLIVIGSSLKVRPVALIPSSIPPNVPQILINREQLNHLEFDVELLGDSDVIINHLCHLLGNEWEEVCWNSNFLHEAKHLKPKSNTDIISSSSSIDDDIKSHTISDFSSSSKSDNLIIDGSNSPFCDSGFDSSSSHPVYNISSSKDSHQLQYQHQQPHYQHRQQSHQSIKNNFHRNSMPQSSSFPYLVSSSSSSELSINDDEKNILFDLKTQQKLNVNNDDITSIDNDDDDNDKKFILKKPSRNLSIDSSKDSGICDTLNISPVSTTVSGINILNNNSNYNDNFHRHNYHDNNCKNNHFHHNSDKKNFIGNKSNQHCYDNDNDNDNNDDGNNHNERTGHHHVLWSSNNKQQTSSSIPSSNSLFVTSTSSSTNDCRSVAERLLENTYYFHSKKCAYVFPGAQVFWNSDSENDDDDDNDDGDEDNNNHNCNDDGDEDDNDDDEEEIEVVNNCESSRDTDDECNDNTENNIYNNDTITIISNEIIENDDDEMNKTTPKIFYGCGERVSESKVHSNDYDVDNENNDDDDVPPNKRRRE